MSNQITGYELTRQWHNFAFENPELIRPAHGALYFYILDQANRFGWKDKFGLPSAIAKEAIGIKSYNTYIATLNDLDEFGFIKVIEKSKNQWTANIIALSNFDKARDKALDKASVKHVTKQMYCNKTTKQGNNKTYNQSSHSGKSENLSDKERKKATFEENYEWFIKRFNEITRSETNGRWERQFRGDAKSKRQLKARIKEGYSGEDFEKAIRKMYRDPFHKDNNFKHATPELITRPDKLEKFLNA